jgi:hypothetical protein
MGTWPPPISPTTDMVSWGARHGRVVTHAVRRRVRPATLWMRVVSMASARRMVSSSRALTAHDVWLQRTDFEL